MFELFFGLVAVFILSIVALAYHRRHQNPIMYQGVKNGAIAAFAFTVTVLGSLPSYASLNLDLDLQPLFDNVTQFFAVFLPVFAIGGGISIAIALVSMIIYQIVKAVRESAK